MLPSIHKLIICLIPFWVKVEHHRNLQYMETATLNQGEQITSFLHSSEELYHNIPLIQCFFYANCYIHTYKQCCISKPSSWKCSSWL